MSKVFTITEGLENLGALSTGGQGSVYKAKRTGTIITAVKLLPTPIHSENSDDRHFKDFQNEVQKLKRVNEEPNPNVVKIMGSGITDSGSLPFIEMEFIEGPDLEELLKLPHDPIFTIKETVRVSEHLAHALAHCHKLDVKHGDVKSNNVKYNLHTGNYVLLDFGLAMMSDEQRRTSLRQAGAIEFMAPEQANGSMLFQTDVYSFGIVIFELLAGRVPFPLNDRSESGRNLVMVAHMETQPPDVLALRKEHLPNFWTAGEKDHEMNVPGWLRDMIYKCLEKDPQNRFPNGMSLYDFILKHSTGAHNEGDITGEQVVLLRNENQKLQEDKRELEQLLQRYQQSAVTAKPGTRPAAAAAGPATVPPAAGGKKTLRNILIGAVLIAAFIGLLVLALMERNRDTPAASPAGASPPTVSTGQATPEVTHYKVRVPRAYFHTKPDRDTRRKSFLIPSNEVITALSEQDGFIYTEFTNSRGQTSKGWVLKDDLTAVD